MTLITQRYPNLVLTVQKLGPHVEPDRKRSIAHWAATQNQFRTEGVLAWLEFDNDGNSWCCWNAFIKRGKVLEDVDAEGPRRAL